MLPHSLHLRYIVPSIEKKPTVSQGPHKHPSLNQPSYPPTFSSNSFQAFLNQILN